MPDRAGPEVDLETITRELRTLLDRSRSYSVQMAATVHPGLDATQYLLLVDIAEMAPVRAAGLVARRRVDKGLISRQVAALERLGLIVRSPDPADSRASLLTLSAAGTEAMTAMEADRRRFGVRLLASLTDGEREELARSLTALNRAIGQL